MSPLVYNLLFMGYNLEHICYFSYGGQILIYRSDITATNIYNYKNHAISYNKCV